MPKNKTNYWKNKFILEIFFGGHDMVPEKKKRNIVRKFTGNFELHNLLKETIIYRLALMNKKK